MSTLTLNLCAPLQSYGYKDFFNIRQTKVEPTISAIAGLIACCAGIERDDPKILEIEKSIKIKEIEKYKTPKKFYDRITADYFTELSDFQILKGTEENPVYTSKQKEYKNNVIIKRDYIEDAYFKVTIESNEKNIEQYKRWLRDPVWVPYIGRKCCSPSIPIFYE